MKALVMFGLSLLSATPGSASAFDFWLTQNGAGTADGSSLANAASCGGAGQASCAAFNNSSNWGAGAKQIGPGTTIHLSGTFNAAAGAACFMTFQGGGNSGAPITLHFETNAVLTAPYWSNGSGWRGGVICTGPGFITIDGGVNGTIQATANGTLLANQIDGGSGVWSPGENNLTIQNLTISNMYVHACSPTSIQPPVTGCPDEGGQSTGGIALSYGGNNITVTGNTVHDAKWCISVGFAGGVTSSNYVISGNTAYNCDHSLAVGSGNNNALLNNVAIDGNVFHDGGNWDDNQDANHHDAIHIWAVHNGAQITGEKVYDNYLYGNWGIDFNSFIFDDDGPGTDLNPQIFNNVMNDQGTLTHYGSGYIAPGSVSPRIYNNTVIGNGTAINAEGGNGMMVENNIIKGGTIYFNGSPTPHVSAWDYNNYDCGTNDNCFNNGPPTLAGWQSLSGLDLHSVSGDPLLTTNFTPQAGSAAIGVGSNLTAQGIPLLDIDKAGNSRPGTGDWDIGAYQYCPPGQCTPAPPPSCGDGICNGNETCASCPGDCGGCTAPPAGTTPADLRNVRVYPNPWRSDKNSGIPVLFANLPASAIVKLFSLSGQLVKRLGPGLSAPGTLAWYLTNDSGDKVASGIYVYLITDGQGDKVRGKLAVIR